MAAEDFAKALKAIREEGLRARVKTGDFSVLGDLNLSAEERTKLQAAANEDPEVEGFASSWS